MIRRPVEPWRNAPKIAGRAIAQELPMTGAQEAILQALDYLKGHSRHSARSAIFHLGRAWSIKELDPEMAAFRCITAEEEAATALFRSVQRLRYPRAAELKPHDHTQKSAVRVLFDVIQKAIHDSAILILAQPSIYFGTPGALPRLHLRAPPAIKVNGKPAVFAPQPPLNFQLNNQDGTTYDFGYEIQAMMSDANIRRMRGELQQRANFRNLLLYAHQDGVPVLDPENLATIILEYRNKTFTTLVFLELIDPYPQHQLFVTQCIDTFLKMLSAVGEIVPQTDDTPDD